MRQSAPFPGQTAEVAARAAALAQHRQHILAKLVLDRADRIIWRHRRAKEPVEALQAALEEMNTAELAELERIALHFYRLENVMTRLSPEAVVSVSTSGLTELAKTLQVPPKQVADALNKALEDGERGAEAARQIAARLGIVSSAKTARNRVELYELLHRESARQLQTEMASASASPSVSSEKGPKSPRASQPAGRSKPPARR